MNKLNIIIILFAATFLMACSEDKSVAADKQETAVEHAGKHLDPNYVCPMHPQIIRGKPGNCPICGMDLVKKNLKQKRKENFILGCPHGCKLSSR